MKKRRGHSGNDHFSEYMPDQEIDLHGYSVLQSKHALDELLHSGEKGHIRIVVGKGKNSPEGPILPLFVKNYLYEHGIAYTPAPSREGGEGALDIYL